MRHLTLVVVLLAFVVNGCASRPQNQSSVPDTRVADGGVIEGPAPVDEPEPVEPMTAEAPPAVAPDFEPADSSPSPAPQPPPQRIVSPFPNVTVNLDERAVMFEGEAALDVGWLEFIVCTPGTKEHESLIVSHARPSDIHAALLLAGFEPGRPGRWVYEDDRISVVPPEGDEIEVTVRYRTTDGQEVIEPVNIWVRDHLGRADFPLKPWVFAGSLVRDAPPHWEQESIYIADYSGSVIGLATFGDELLAFPEVIAHETSVQPAEWEVNAAHVPPPGTLVTVILRPAGSDRR